MSRTLRKPLCALALACLPVLGVAACGGGGGIPITSFPTPTVTTQALTKTDYITKADAICVEANSALGSLPAADAVTLISQKVDIQQNLVDQLTGLGIPTEDSATLQGFVDAENTILDNQKKAQLAQQRGESTGAFDTAITTAQAKALASAESYGLQECGKGATSTGSVSPSAPAAPAPAAPAPGTGGGGGGGGTGGGGGGGGSGGVGPG